MNVINRLLPYLKPYRSRFFQAGAAMVFVALSNGAVAFLVKPVIDGIFIYKDNSALWLVTLSVPLLFALKSTTSYVQNYLMSWIGQRGAQQLREDLFTHLHTLSLEFHGDKKSGEILARVTNDLTLVQSMLQFVPLYLIRDFLTVIVLVSVLFYQNWKFALVALGIIPMVAILIVILGRKMRDASAKSQAIMGDIYQRFQESLQGMLVIKAYNYEKGAIKKFQVENQSFFNQMMRYLRATALSGPLMEFLGSLIIAALIYFGGREILLGRMTPGEFSAFLTAFFLAYAPVKNLGKLNSELQRGLASADRIFQILEEPPTIVDKPGAGVFPGLKKAIHFENVNFRYPSRELPALDGLDLTVRRGETAAVVGPSGSGKSTLVQILLRLYDPDQGAVLLDGKDLREYAIHTVRSQIGLVTQETVLFNDTVFANIVIGRPDVKKEDVVRAAQTADAHQFISSLPQGYDTVLGDRGMRLSGGQRQRLAIARAVLTNPPILVLDEATSNLDSSSEAEVQRALERLMGGRTVIVIAHRLSTIQGADRIHVISQGRIAESGTHRELLARGGIYKRLRDLQASEPLDPSPIKAEP